MPYLFPSPRNLFIRYFPWLLIPLAIVTGYGGYIIGIESMSTDTEISRPGTLFAGIFGGFSIFVWTYLGMSLILKASRAIYTKKTDIEADVRFATEVQERILEDVLLNTIHQKHSLPLSPPMNWEEIFSSFPAIMRLFMRV